MPSEIKLPPYKRLTHQFRQALEFRLHVASRKTGVLSQIEGHIIHEGRSSSIKRHAEDDEEETEMFQSSREVSLTHMEIENIDVAKVLDIINWLAEGFMEDKSKSLFRLLDEVTSKTGNVLDGGGQPLSAELLFQMMEKVQGSYDPATGRSNAILVVHPDMMKRVQEIDREVRSNPDMMRRLAEIEARKRDEFRTDQMDRELAG